MSGPLLTALHNLFAPHVLLTIVLAAVYGIFVGAIPGLTATMAVALIVPLTFFLDDLSALAAIVTLVATSITAGDIPTTLVRIPGTPASAAYADDAYALTRAGRHRQALGTSLLFSVAGGLFGALVLCTAAPLLARAAFAFTTYEYFWLYVLGLSCAAIVSHDSRLKGAIALVIGLLFSTVGLSEVHSIPRFTFGRDELVTGVNFIPAMIGLFGASEVFRSALTLRRSAVDGGLISATAVGSSARQSSILAEVLPDLWRRKWSALRSSSVGVVIGMIPGAGADIAAWIAYAVSKRFSRTPQEYGRGSLDGLADATAANNASLAGAWIPALVFGVPGDSVTAIVIGVLLMKNVRPGPEIFTQPKQAALVYGIYLTFILANLLLIPLGLLAIRMGSLLIRVPRRVLMPVILLFCLVGAYAINGSRFDVAVMLGMGALGLLLERCAVPLGPVVLGIILGGPLEQSFVQNLAKSSSPWAFFSRPVAAGLGLACVVLWLAPPLLRLVRRDAPGEMERRALPDR